MQTRVKLRKNSTRPTLILSYIFCSLTNGSLPKDCLINMYLFPYCLQYPRQSSNPPWPLALWDKFFLHGVKNHWGVSTSGFPNLKFCLSSFNRTTWIGDQPVANSGQKKHKTYNVPKPSGIRFRDPTAPAVQDTIYVYVVFFNMSLLTAEGEVGGHQFMCNIDVICYMTPSFTLTWEWALQSGRCRRSLAAMRLWAEF